MELDGRLVIGTQGVSELGRAFLTNNVIATGNDPRHDLEEAMLTAIEIIKTALKALDYNIKGLTRNLSFEKDLPKAIQNADLIQESEPENIAFKHEANKKPMALVLSSSSGIPATYNDNGKTVLLKIIHHI